MRWRIVLIIVAVLCAAGAASAIAFKTPAAGCTSDERFLVTIKNGQVSPGHTSADRCAKLTIKNLDRRSRLIAFGPHEEHVPYDGVAERLLGQGESFTVTLNQPGSFRFHDHLDDAVQGTFTVAAAK